MRQKIVDISISVHEDRTTVWMLQSVCPNHCVMSDLFQMKVIKHVSLYFAENVIMCGIARCAIDVKTVSLA
jgi:hypothetical protein